MEREIKQMDIKKAVTDWHQNTNTKENLEVPGYTNLFRLSAYAVLWSTLLPDHRIDGCGPDKQTKNTHSWISLPYTAFKDSVASSKSYGE